jgi:hypothetical protein
MFRSYNLELPNFNRKAVVKYHYMQKTQFTDELTCLNFTINPIWTLYCILIFRANFFTFLGSSGKFAVITCRQNNPTPMPVILCCIRRR